MGEEKRRGGIEWKSKWRVGVRVALWSSKTKLMLFHVSNFNEIMNGNRDEDYS